MFRSDANVPTLTLIQSLRRTIASTEGVILGFIEFEFVYTDDVLRRLDNPIRVVLGKKIVSIQLGTLSTREELTGVSPP